MRALPMLLAALVLAVPAGALAKGKGGKPAAAAARDPFEGWIEAEDLIKENKPAEALGAMRNAIAVIERMDDKAKVTGPKGLSWDKAEGLFRYRMRAGDLATQLDYRDAVPLYEGALAVAPDKVAKKDARMRLKAAKENVEAGIKSAPSFMSDDYGELAEEAKKPPPEKEEPAAAGKKGEKSWEKEIASDPRE